MQMAPFCDKQDRLIEEINFCAQTAMATVVTQVFTNNE